MFAGFKAEGAERRNAAHFNGQSLTCRCRCPARPDGRANFLNMFPHFELFHALQGRHRGSGPNRFGPVSATHKSLLGHGHHRGSPNDGRHRKAIGECLGENRDVWVHAEGQVDAAKIAAPACRDFIKDEDGAGSISEGAHFL